MVDNAQNSILLNSDDLLTSSFIIPAMVPDNTIGASVKVMKLPE